MATVSHRELTRDSRRGDATAAHARPQRRSDCVAGPRPCPYVGCRYHLLVDVTYAGSLYLPLGDPLEALEHAPATCALDVAATGPRSLEAIAGMHNVTRERVAQIVDEAMAKLARYNRDMAPAAPIRSTTTPRRLRARPTPEAPMSVPVKTETINHADAARVAALHQIDDRFGVGDSVRKLRKLMDDVTAKEVTPDTVNAACNCVSNINQTIRTAMQAAQFLAGK